MVDQRRWVWCRSTINVVSSRTFRAAAFVMARQSPPRRRYVATLPQAQAQGSACAPSARQIARGSSSQRQPACLSSTLHPFTSRCTARAPILRPLAPTPPYPLHPLTPRYPARHVRQSSARSAAWRLQVCPVQVGVARYVQTGLLK